MYEVMISDPIFLQPRGKTWISSDRDYSKGKTWTGDFLKTLHRRNEPHGHGVLVHPEHEQLESEEGTMVHGSKCGLWVQKYRSGCWTVLLFRQDNDGIAKVEVPATDPTQRHTLGFFPPLPPPGQNKGRHTSFAQ